MEKKFLLHFTTLETYRDKAELLLHPVMKAFLEIKWMMFQRTYLTNLLIDVIFVILLTILGKKYHTVNRYPQ